MTESPQDFASATAEKITESLKAGAETQKNAGAEAIASFARSAREAAKDLDEASPQIARLMRSAADSVERVGDDLRGKSLSDLAASLDRFAAERPMIFLGCGVLAGIAIGRLLPTGQK